MTLGIHKFAPKKMASVWQKITRPGAIFLAVTLLLASCVPGQFGGFGGVGGNRPVSGTVLGKGQVRVGLLLPMTAAGNAGVVGASLRNAAALALQDFPNANIQLIVKDTQGTPQGAQAAASAVIAQGAELILGPLFGEAVRPVASVAAPRNIPVISFSTRSDVATRGAYLMGFLPRDQVYRAAKYAASKRKKSFAILVPNTPAGLIYEGLFREAAANTGIRIVTIERYALDRTAMQQKVAELAKVSSQIDGVFMPDSADSVSFLAQQLASSGIRAPRVMFVGSGQWDDPRIAGEPSLKGAIFASAPNARFNQFSQKYASAYRSTPPRTASLAYDATILAAGLTARFGQSRFTASTLTGRDGFAGVDGVFRFNADGTNTRTMAVYEVQPGGIRVVSPAPASLKGL